MTKIWQAGCDQRVRRCGTKVRCQTGRYNSPPELYQTVCSFWLSLYVEYCSDVMGWTTLLCHFWSKVVNPQEARLVTIHSYICKRYVWIAWWTRPIFKLVMCQACPLDQFQHVSTSINGCRWNTRQKHQTDQVCPNTVDSSLVCYHKQVWAASPHHN